MKKIVLIISFGLTLYGSVLHDAIKEYKGGNYKKSFEILNKNKWENFSNEKYNYYLCKSAYMVKNYKVSLSSCERILLNNPNHQYARYGLGLAQFKLHMYEDAKNEFEFLLNDLNLNPRIKPYVKEKLRLVNNAIKGDSFKLTLGVGIVYNSNSHQISGDRIINVPALNVNVKTDDKKSDFYHQELANLNYTKRLNRDGLSLTNNLFAVNEGYFKQKKQDMVYFGYQPSLVYDQEKYKLKLGLQASRLHRNKDDRLNIFSINPGVGFKLSPNVRLNFQAMVMAKRYLKSNKDYDSNVYEGSASFEHSLLDSMWLWKATYGNERKQNDVRNDVSYDYGDGSLEIYLPLYEKLVLNIKNSYKYKKYKDENVFFLNKREDSIYNGELSLMYGFADTWLLKMFYNFKSSDSNQKLYDFNQYLVGLNIYKTFEF